MEADQYSALGAHGDDDDDDAFRSITGAHPGGSNTFSHADYTQNIDPTLNGHARSAAAQLHHQHQHQHHQHHQHHQRPQSQHHQDPTNPYADAAQIQRQFYGTAYTMHTPSENMSEPSPGQFTSVSPVPGARQLAPTYTPQDRTLPSKDITDDTIDDAYVQFILYCNPSVPLDTDTTELRKVFRMPPRSDGKVFNMFNLMGLIEKYENKELKTWTKLAIKLGVEKTEKSSAQKVQQYAVRLKRWMHAMHVDAFFEYMLGKPHPYYQEIPPINEPPPRSREGVPIEEDLALRALHPETRPKRGRRKLDASSVESSEKDQPPAKRHHLDTSEIDHFVYPDSAIPTSSSGIDRYLDDPVSHDQWAAATQSVLSAHPNSASTPITAGGQQFRWRAFSKLDSAPNPQSTHPSSASPSAQTSALLLSHPDDIPTPTTATTPGSSKPSRRRRHGPAVSSAWPSSSNSLTGKLRGRPPQNRSTRDGPFSMFPAKATTSVSMDTISATTLAATPTPTPIVSHPPRSFTTSNGGSLNGSYRQMPPNLQLKVPQIPRRVIAMASPSPATTAAVLETASASDIHMGEWPPQQQQQQPSSAPVLQTQPQQMLGKRAFADSPVERMERELVVRLMKAGLRQTSPVNAGVGMGINGNRGYHNQQMYQQQHQTRQHHHQRQNALIGMEKAKRIAAALFRKLKATPGVSEERIAAMIGYPMSIDMDGSCVFQDLVVEKVQSQNTQLDSFGLNTHNNDGDDDEGEDEDDIDDTNDNENNTHDDEQDEEDEDDVNGINGDVEDRVQQQRRRGKVRYQLTWATGVGPLKAKVSCVVSVSSTGLTNSSEHAGSNGIISDRSGGSGDPEKEGLRKIVKILEQELRGKEAEMRRVRENVLRAIVDASETM